jgi:hypothetical protein
MPCHLARQERQQVAVGVLGDEDGMAAHGRLLAVVQGMRRRQPIGDEAFAVLQNGIKAMAVQIGEVGVVELEAAAEAGLAQGSEEAVRIAHVTSVTDRPVCRASRV